MLKGDVSSCRQHARAHELVGRVGLLAPQHRRQRGQALLVQMGENPCVIGIEHEIGGERPGGIADVDADEPAGLQFFYHRVPYRVQHPVHGFKSPAAIALTQRFPDGRALAGKGFIPHGDHGIRRRGHHQVHALVLYFPHPAGISKIEAVGGLHGVPDCACRQSVARHAALTMPTTSSGVSAILIISTSSGDTMQLPSSWHLIHSTSPPQ